MKHLFDIKKKNLLYLLLIFFFALTQTVFGNGKQIDFRETASYDNSISESNNNFSFSKSNLINHHSENEQSAEHVYSLKNLKKHKHLLLLSRTTNWCAYLKKSNYSLLQEPKGFDVHKIQSIGYYNNNLTRPTYYNFLFRLSPF